MSWLVKIMGCCPFKSLGCSRQIWHVHFVLPSHVSSGLKRLATALPRSVASLLCATGHFGYCQDRYSDPLIGEPSGVGFSHLIRPLIGDPSGFSPTSLRIWRHLEERLKFLTEPTHKTPTISGNNKRRNAKINSDWAGNEGMLDITIRFHPTRELVSLSRLCGVPDSSRA